MPACCLALRLVSTFNLVFPANSYTHSDDPCRDTPAPDAPAASPAWKRRRWTFRRSKKAARSASSIASNFHPGSRSSSSSTRTRHAENERYVEIAEFLAAHGIRAPKIFFHDPAEGLIWIEDLGERDLWSYRDESWAVRRPFYESALEEIAKLHRVSAADSAEIRADLPAQFDAALYLWEQRYFFENCLGRHFGVEAKGAA